MLLRQTSVHMNGLGAFCHMIYGSSITFLSIMQLPRTGSRAVMRPDSFVGYGAI